MDCILSESLCFRLHCKSSIMKTPSPVEEREKKKDGVWLYWSGCERPPTHRCNPTSIWRGSFCLLCFHPRPLRFSLTNLGSTDSSILPMLTPNLARTPDQHRTTAPRSPDLKLPKHPSLQVARLQACATTPGWYRGVKFNYCIFSITWYTGTQIDHTTSGEL